MNPNKIIFYSPSFRYQVELEEGKEIQLGNHSQSLIPLPDLDSVIHLKREGNQVFYQMGEELGLLENGVKLGPLTFYLPSYETRYYDPVTLKQFVLGDHPGYELYLPNSSVKMVIKRMPKDALYQDGPGQVNPENPKEFLPIFEAVLLSGTIYHNNVRKERGAFLLRFGSEIAFENQLFKFFPHEIQIWSPVTVTKRFGQLNRSRFRYPTDYPDWHRSPRVIYRPNEEKLELVAPPAEPRKPEHEVLRMVIPPLLMIAMTIVISIFQPRGLYILLTVVMSISTMIFSIISFFKGRKKYAQEKQERIDNYKHYLQDKAIAFTQLDRKQAKGQAYHYPEIEEIIQMAQDFSPRIYEKAALHVDFLTYRLGLGSVPTAHTIRYNQMERSGQKDPLEVQGFELYKRHKTLENQPIVGSLMQGPVGYIGPRNLVIEQLQLLVHQLAFFHSYHDLQFVTIFPEEEKDQWNWMRFLPHATLQDFNVRGFVYNQRTRDQVLTSLTQVLKVRRSKLESREVKEGALFTPHYVVLVTDESLILDHVIMEFFREDPTALGCSLIFVQDVLSALSENVQTIISIKDSTVGQILLQEGQLKEKNFQLDHFPYKMDKEFLARRLAPLNHIQTLASSIPETVSFLELYEATTIEDLAITKRWQEHAPYQSLAVPIGLRGKEDVVQLNLHEKAHGPHGLIAGTTGSGKSELIQSYILSLAVNFHPHDVAFLLIDYKGGGMANLFKNLPHLLGTITNLDGNQSMRALASINAELKRRQRLFAQVDVNHINLYQKKYKQGQAPEPLPHLFLISDEFAELKSNQPEFMKELVSTARIGRSLGIHLILATQKPTGVVDDQIWSNSRFKLALKVADRSDSMEMLHTGDAADITQVGRAYLQVGNNEIYELFQSAYSGADYAPNKEKQGIEDQAIYLINDLGQYEILNQDLSGLDQAFSYEEVPTELDAIVDYIQELTQAQNIQSLPQPWLPPLPEKIFVEELEKEFEEKAPNSGSHKDLVFTFGLADIPQEQAQEAVSINLSQDGNVALYGNPGSGKTSFLQTAVMSLARHYDPSQVQFYLLDFGTNGLAPLSKLPHVADWLTLDQEEKISKFTRILDKEVKRRKALLAKHGVGTIKLYEEVTGDTEASLVIVIDSFEGMKDAPYEEELLKLLVRLTREGLAIGIHVILTAGRQLSLRAALHSNIKIQMSLPQNDYSDVTAAVGPTPLARSMETIKGRILMKRDDVQVVQVALPIEATTDAALIEKLRNESIERNKQWTGLRPSAIPMVPEELTEEYFYNLPSVLEALDKGQIPLGLDIETVEPITWDTRENLLYLTDKETQMIRFVNLIEKAAERVIVLAPEYVEMEENESLTIAQTSISQAGVLLALKEKLMEEAQLSSVQRILVLYDWISLLDTLDKESLKTLDYLLTHGKRLGCHVIVISSPLLSGKIDSISKQLRASKQSIVGMRLSDQSVIQQVQKPYREKWLEPQELYYVWNGQVIKMKTLMG